MFCKKCGSSINEGASFCANCGEPVGVGSSVNGENAINDMTVKNGTNDTNVANGTDAVNAGAGQEQVIPSVSSLWNMYSQDGQPAGGQSMGQSAGRQADGQSGGGQFAGQFAGGQFFNTQPGKSQKGGFQKFIADHKILLAAGTAVIVILFLILVNLATVSNFLRRTFSSPEDYYHYVEKKTVEEFSENAGEIYGRYFLERLHVSDQTASARIDMTLGEGGRELMRLAGLSGVDLSWFESASLKMDSSVKKDAVSMGLGIVVNGVDIVTGNVVMDFDNEVVYLQVPEVNERYMGIEVPDSGFGDMEEIWAMYELLERVCPNQAEMEKLINRYLMTAVESMDDVSKEKSVLEVEDIEQKCTVLTVTADANTLKRMTIEILSQMRDDKDIEKIIKTAMSDEEFVEAFYYLDGLSPKEAYEEFQKWADSMVEDLEDLGELEIYDDETLVMNVYVNGKGKIVGRIIEIDEEKISMLMPEKGRQFGYELSYEDSYFADPDYDESMALTGTGRRSGDKIDGEFVLSYNNTSIMDISVQDLNTEDMKKGMMNGSMVLGLSGDIEDLLGYTPGMSMMQGAELSLDFHSDKTSGNCKAGVSLRDKDIVDVEVAYKREKGYKGAVPGKDAVMVDDTDDLIKWGKYLKLDGLSESLKEADVPSEVTDSLDMLDGMDMESLFRMMYFYY